MFPISTENAFTKLREPETPSSGNIMRSKIGATCSKPNKLSKQIIECRSQLSVVRPSVLPRSICTKIQALNCKLFNHLEQTKNNNLEKPHWSSKKQGSTSRKQKPTLQSQFQKIYHFRRLKNLFLAKALTSFLQPKNPTNSQPNKMSKNLFAFS